MRSLEPYQKQIITKADLIQLQAELIDTMHSLVEVKQPDTKRWLRSSEVRKLLNISPGTLQNLRISGTLKYSKLGGTLFYDREEIHRILEENKCH